MYHAIKQVKKKQILLQYYMTFATWRQFATLATIKASYNTGINVATKPVFAHPFTIAAASGIYKTMKCTFLKNVTRLQYILY